MYHKMGTPILWFVLYHEVQAHICHNYLIDIGAIMCFPSASDVTLYNMGKHDRHLAQNIIKSEPCAQLFECTVCILYVNIRLFDETSGTKKIKW